MPNIDIFDVQKDLAAFTQDTNSDRKAKAKIQKKIFLKALGNGFVTSSVIALAVVGTVALVLVKADKITLTK